MTASRIASISALPVLLSVLLFAQDGPKLQDKSKSAAPPADQASTIKVQARLINIPAIVRNKKGELIATLKMGDLDLQVDGKPQAIRYFDTDAKLPLSLGLLVDTSGSMRNYLDDERKASTAFLEGMLETDSDKAFVVEFSRKADLLADMTNSRAKLQAGLKQLSSDNDDSGGGSPTWGRNGGNNRNGSNNGNNGGTDDNDNQNGGYGRRSGTVLYDAVFLSSDELMKKQQGRKALIILTDGVDRNSKESLTDALEATQKTDTVIFGIYYKGEQPRGNMNNNNNCNNRRGGMGGGYPGGGYPGGGYPGGGYPGGGGRGCGQQPGGGGNGRSYIDGKKVLERMAGETGGNVFEVSKKMPIEEIYKEIGRELRTQYRIQFTPSDKAAAEGYHQIDLIPKDAKLTVQTRDGYYMNADDSTK